MALNIVLFEPEIPNNTGNIGRLSLATGSNLHLVKPYGFELTDSRVKRAGLDYWQHVSLFEYDNVDSFFDQHGDKKMAFLSSHGKRVYTDIPFEEDYFLIFGKESTGLGSVLREKHHDQLYNIPLFSDHIRSLNLGNSVGIVVYEGLRQLNLTL